MKSLFCAASVAALMLATSGCAGLTHFNTNDRAGEGHTTYFVDAKQRIVSTGQTRDRETEQYLYMVCAEPSPDALSAIAAAQGLSLSKSDIQAALSNSITEGAGSIGLRTQSIQLMRDSMYRLCEAHMSGFIGDLAFETLHRRFQSSMVAILAIEQLTSVARPPAITLGGISGGAGVDLVAESSELMLRADRDYKAAGEATKKAQEEYNTAVAARDAKKKVSTETPPAESEEEETPAGAPPATPAPSGEPTLEQLEKAVTDKKALLDAATKREGELKEEFEYFQSARRAALAGSRTEIRLDIEQGRGPGPQDAARVAELSKAVQAIVENTLTLSFTDELCTTILVAAADGQLNPKQSTVGPRLTPEQTAMQREMMTQLATARANRDLKEIERAKLVARLGAMDLAKEEDRDIRNNLAVVDQEISALLSSEFRLEMQIEDLAGPDLGKDVIEGCTMALQDRARAERDRWTAEMELEQAKTDALKYALGQSPADAVAIIDALARLEAAKRSNGDETPAGSSQQQ